MRTSYSDSETEQQGFDPKYGSIQLFEEAVKRDLLSVKELIAVQKGNAIVGKTYLFNLNADLHFPTGLSVTLYEGRGTEIDSRILLGLEVVEAYYTGNPYD